MNFVNSSHYDKTILISPLNWGLGHATRCIPLIKILKNSNCRIIICGNGDSLKLLKQEFSELEFIELKSYKIFYSKSSWHFLLRLFVQVPKFLFSMYIDYLAAKKICTKYKPDIIFSDNRYGFYNKNTVNIIISHQIKPIVPNCIKYLKNIVNFIIHKCLQKFDEVWIPDFEDSNNLSGKLSHHINTKLNIKYCGPLSRFDNKLANEANGLPLAIVSGPEPQRTILQNLLFRFFEHYKIKAIIIGGVPSKNENYKNSYVTFYSHLKSKDLCNLIIEAPYIISRSGYSSIMDYFILNKKAILIPTANQSEQIYLANYHSVKKTFLSAEENLKSIKAAVSQIDNFDISQNTYNNEYLIKCINEVLKK